MIDFQLSSYLGFVTIAGLASPIILYLLLRSKWKFLEKQKKPMLLIITILVIIVFLGIYFQLNKNTLHTNIGLSINIPSDWIVDEVYNGDNPEVGSIKISSKEGDSLLFTCYNLIEEGYWKNTLDKDSINLDLNNPKKFEDKNYEVLYSGDTKVKKIQKYLNYEVEFTDSNPSYTSKLSEKGEKVIRRRIYFVTEDKSCLIFISTLPERKELLYPSIEKSIDTFKI